MPSIRVSYNTTLPCVSLVGVDMTWVQFIKYLSKLVYNFRGEYSLESDIITRLDDNMLILIRNLFELEKHMSRYHCRVRTFNEQLSTIMDNGVGIYKDIIYLINKSSIATGMESENWYVRELLGIDRNLRKLIILLNDMRRWNEVEVPMTYDCIH